MRHTAIPVALLIVLAAATPALADGGGLPEIASLQIGSHTVAVHDDSPALHTGTNTFTVEIPGLTADHAVKLWLTGPSGQTVTVPLSDLTVLADSTDDMADMPGMPDMPGMSHGHGGQDTHQDAAGSFDARGKASLNETGTWTLQVEIAGHDSKQSAHLPVDVEQGGPSRLYLGVTGLLMGGSLTYGVVQRRRRDNGR